MTQAYFSAKVSTQAIESEHLNSHNRPPKYQNQNCFPYSALPSSRDFERLIYCLYAHPKTLEKADCFYDEALLMQGTHDRGRDIWLKRAAQSVGLVQCKKYKKTIRKTELSKEILKFVLHSIKDHSLMSLSLEKFEYHIAVSTGIDEHAQNYISDFNSNIFNKEEITNWSKDVIKEYSHLKYLSFDAIEKDIFDKLKKIHITPVYPEEIDLRLYEKQDILKLFFQVESVIDIETFEEVLERRQQKEISFSETLTSMEDRLRELDKSLFQKLESIKIEAQKLYNKYSGNCLEYSDHRKEHQESLIRIVSGTIISRELLSELNKYELFVLSASCYLTDIGVCQDDRKLFDELDLNYLLPHESLCDKVRERHHELSQAFILERYRSLKIPEKYSEAISLISSVSLSTVNEITNSYKYQWEFEVDKFERDKICIPLLAFILILGDLLDIDFTNTETILKKYVEFSDFLTSKLLWEEVENLIQISPPSHDNGRLKFQGEINNQILFLGISERIESIRKVISKCDETLRKNPKNKTIDIKFIDNEIASPFKNNFGFSLEYEHILSTFLGKKIYKDEYIGIREVIQNAIDACLLRETIEEEVYQPEITVELDGDLLIVKDNGIGMDRHILKEYFAKIGRSYYRDNNVKNSIGQFGVGVYAYFMLCDHFTIETKTYQSQTFKLTISHNMPYGFYFHEVDNREIGTTVWLPIKPEIYITINSLSEYINRTFKYSPIRIKFSNTKETIEFTEFSLSKESIIESCVKLPYQEEFKAYIYINICLETEHAVGSIGLFIPPNFSDPESFNLRKKGTSLKIFQRGVYVNKMTHFSGEINLKTPLPLMVDRENFEDTQTIYEIVDDFEIELLKEILNSQESEGPFSNTFTDFYLFNFYGNHKVSREKLEFMSNIFSIQLFSQGKLFLIKLNQLQSFDILGIHIRRDTSDSNLPIEELAKLKIPFISVIPFVNASFFKRYLSYLDFGYRILNLEHCSIILASCQHEEYESKLRQSGALIIPFEDNTLCTSVPLLGESEYINVNHPLIEHIENNIDRYYSETNLRQAIDQFLDELMNIIKSAYPPSQFGAGQRIGLWRLNPFLEKINAYFGTSFQLSEDDFPSWMHERISSNK
ncbi:HD domain-containing protein [Leptothoe spongobia]|uniref:ATP-binding protein n=1 Tax=Leptothoe spongobia TAU-MAC 1115 TaxID=1967444 RepID=A0A947GHQ3_9CYAN|nr:ATP-binding protein [Leptothoe spongobia]MBT9315114.1 ATP-binding protein [Leptothoe spongobia TAU-MAC 1115]